MKEKEYLYDLKQNIGKMTSEELEERELYLRNLALGKIEGPQTGLASVDKPWLAKYSEDIVKSSIPKNSLYGFIYENNKDHLDDLVFIAPEKVTYGEMFNRIDEVAKSLTAIGVKEGDLVAVGNATTPEAFYLIYALDKIGAICDSIDALASKSDLINKYLTETNTEYLFINDLSMPEVSKIIGKNNVKNIIVKELMLPKSEIKSNGIITSWEDFISAGKNVELETKPYVENKTSILEHTGGTTGFPKGAMLTNDGLNGQAWQISTSLNFERGEIALGLMPVFASFGLMFAHTAIAYGIQLVLVPLYDPSKFIDLVNEYKPNRFACSPAFWENLLRDPRSKDLDISSFKNPIVGGDLMNEKIEKQVNEYFKSKGNDSVLTKGYSSTESSAGTTCNLGKDCNKLVSVGVPFPKIDIKIVSPDTMQEVPYGVPGEICISGSNLMNGFYNKPEETEKVLKKHDDGKVWLHSGDIGYMDDEGFTYIINRIKRIIIRNDGCKVYPTQIENVILKHEDVSYCSVVGVNDPDHLQGELPYAYVVVNESAQDRLSQIKDEIYALCNDNLPIYSIPMDICFMKELDKTKVGKVDYVSLQEKANQKIKIK